MNMRICCPNDEYQMLLSLVYCVWGSKSNTFRGFRIGDKLLFAIKNADKERVIAAAAEISSTPFFDDQQIIWNGKTRGNTDKYPYRIRIKPLVFLKEESRIAVRDVLQRFDPHWSIRLRDQSPIDRRAAEVLNLRIESCDNALDEFQKNTHELLSETWERNRGNLASLFGISNPHPKDYLSRMNPNPPCPKCRSKKTFRLVYGLIDELSALGPFEYAAGCGVSPEKYICLECGERW